MPTLPLVGGSGMAAKGACPKRRTQCCKRGRLKAIFLFHLRNEIDPTGRNDFATAFASGSANHWFADRMYPKFSFLLICQSM